MRCMACIMDMCSIIITTVIPAESRDLRLATDILSFRAWLLELVVMSVGLHEHGLHDHSYSCFTALGVAATYGNTAWKALHLEEASRVFRRQQGGSIKQPTYRVKRKEQGSECAEQGNETPVVAGVKAWFAYSLTPRQ